MNVGAGLQPGASWKQGTKQSRSTQPISGNSGADMLRK
jgi:hypothetical protein